MLGSMNESPQLDQFRKFAEDFLDVAGRIAMDYYGKVAVETKAKFDLVTQADREIEERFVDELKKQLPDHGVLGEETGSSNPSVAGWYWVIDPIDGTMSYASQAGVFSIAIALLRDGVPVMAWIDDPVHRERFFAGPKGPAYLNGEALPQLGDDVTPAISVATESILRYVKTMEKIFNEFGRARSYGSQALHLAYIAAGRMNVMFNTNGKLWDDVAGAHILAAAGGAYGRTDGTSPFPVRDGDPCLSGAVMHGVGASSEAIYRQIVAWLAEED